MHVQNCDFGSARCKKGSCIFQWNVEFKAIKGFQSGYSGALSQPL